MIVDSIIGYSINSPDEDFSMNLNGRNSNIVPSVFFFFLCYKSENIIA